jgi:dTDP-4-amino-4,6-dideoxygalactose transaminase
MQVKFFDLKKQNDDVKDEFLAEIKEVIDSNQFVLGPKVEDLEEKISGFCDVKYAVALSSGTDALLVALMAIGVEPGDEIITTPFTFFATCSSIVRSGAIPVFADIDTDTFNIDPADIKKKITNKTKGIMPVHLYGQCADMNKINSIAKENGLFVIEDAAQAIGAKIGEDKAGSFSDIGCFSFCPTKNLGGFGEGGMAVCNTEELYKKMSMLRNHGSAKRYYHEYIGGNFRMDAFQAAGLSVKLKRLDGYIKKRRGNASLYMRHLSGLEHITLPAEENGCFHTFNQFVIKTKRRDELRDFLTKNGISTQIYYPVCLHEQNCFKYLGYKTGDLAAAEQISQSCLALPIYPELKEDEIIYVSENIKAFF